MNNNALLRFRHGHHTPDLPRFYHEHDIFKRAINCALQFYRAGVHALVSGLAILPLAHVVVDFVDVGGGIFCGMRFLPGWVVGGGVKN